MAFIMRRHTHRIAAVFFLLALLGGIGFGWKYYISISEVAEVSEEPGSVTGRPAPKKVISRTLSFGDVFWGRYIDDWAKQSSNRLEYPFSGLSTFGRENYDAWIADLECPLTDTYISSAEQDRLLSFSCPKDYTANAAKWFTAFTIANNHTGNQEQVGGFKQTQDTLANNGIQYFGNFDPKVYGDVCEIIDLPARYLMNDGTYKQADLPIAMCAVHSVFELPDQNVLNEITKYSKVLPVWVYGHMGTEYTTLPSEIQQATYRSYIDAGADIVIGDHPHRVQTAESYKGKLIVYSLGNFIFDQLGASEQGGREVWRGMGLGIEVSAEIDQSVLLWTKLSNECQKYDDSCIETAATQGLFKPKYDYVFSVVTSDNSNKGVAKKASDEWHNETLNRLQWDSLIPELAY